MTQDTHHPTTEQPGALDRDGDIQFVAGAPGGTATAEQTRAAVADLMRRTGGEELLEDLRSTRTGRPPAGVDYEAGRPRSVRLPSELDARLNDYLAQVGASRSTVLIAALEGYLVERGA